MIAIHVGSRIRSLEESAPSGDAFAEIACSRGVIVTLTDGLGHGERAAHAAHAYLDSIRANKDEAVSDMFARAHSALTKTRGSVAALARFDVERGEVEIAGLGNITTFIARGAGGRTTPIVVPAGVLGSAFRSVRPQTMPFGMGDTLIMHTDGVRSRFDYSSMRALTPQQIADTVIRIAGKGTDDAGCVVARGAAPAIVPNIQPPSAPLSEPPPLSLDARRVPITVPSDPATCALEARNYAAQIGLPLRAQWEVSIAASELASNVLKFAGEGTLTLSREGDELVMDVLDRGRGIEEVESAVVDGWSEGGKLTPDRPRRQGQGLGVGLGTVHRMMDRVRVESEPGRGTRIVAHKKK